VQQKLFGYQLNIVLHLNISFLFGLMMDVKSRDKFLLINLHMVQIIFLYRPVIFPIGGNENTKVGVAGDSAGGLIAASICHTIKNLDFQVIVLYLIKNLIF
jgi:hypothetical protein